MLSIYTLKTIDAIVFAVIFYFATQYYNINYVAFELLTSVSVVYIGIRRPDINTLTLLCILVMASVLSVLLLPNPELISGYRTHFTLFAIDVVMLALIGFRPVLISNYGPARIGDNKNLTVTHQDMVMGFLFLLQTAFQLLQLLEHLTRHREDIGLGRQFGDWQPMFFYDIYKTGQLGFTIGGFVILYFMTFDKSKDEANARLKT